MDSFSQQGRLPEITCSLPLLLVTKIVIKNTREECSTEEDIQSIASAPPKELWSIKNHDPIRNTRATCAARVIVYPFGSSEIPTHSKVSDGVHNGMQRTPRDAHQKQHQSSQASEQRRRLPETHNLLGHFLALLHQSGHNEHSDNEEQEKRENEKRQHWWRLDVGSQKTRKNESLPKSVFKRGRSRLRK